MKQIVELLLSAPDSQLDDQAKELIKLWDECPKALQILKVLDVCAYAALASDTTMTILDIMYKTALKAEGKTHEDMVALATWRTNGTLSADSEFDKKLD